MMMMMMIIIIIVIDAGDSAQGFMHRLQPREAAP